MRPPALSVHPTTILADPPAPGDVALTDADASVGPVPSTVDHPRRWGLIRLARRVRTVHGSLGRRLHGVTRAAAARIRRVSVAVLRTVSQRVWIAATHLVPPRLPAPYQALRAHLARQPGDEVTLSFAALEALMGEPLPPAAWQRRWWANTTAEVQGRAWLTAGWGVRWVRQGVNGVGVTFVRQAATATRSPTTAGRR